MKLEGEAGAKRIQEIMTGFRTSDMKDVAGVKIVRIEDYKECRIVENGKERELTGFTKSDVLKYYLEDGSWIAIRPSGTEPKCKFYYCVRGASFEEVQQKTNAYQKAWSWKVFV